MDITCFSGYGSRRAIILTVIRWKLLQHRILTCGRKPITIFKMTMHQFCLRNVNGKRMMDNNLIKVNI